MEQKIAFCVNLMINTIGVMLTLNGYDDNKPFIAFALLQNLITMYLIFIATI